jgi:putative membrane protein
VLAAQFPAFHPHPEVVLLASVIAASYAILLKRVGPRYVAPGTSPASRFQITCFALGLSAMFLAAEWPIHDLAEGYLYSVHMVQHLTFSLVCAPLFLLGTPAWMARWVLRNDRTFRLVRFLSRFLPAIILFSVVVAFTHWPAFVDLTLRSGAVHFGAHALLLITSLIVWMPILSPLPEIPRVVAPLKMLYLFLQTVLPTIPASFLTMGDHPLYRRYELFPRLWGLSALDDQQIAGLIMKIGSGLVLVTLIGVVFFKWAASEESRNRPGRVHDDDLDRELDELGLRA